MGKVYSQNNYKSTLTSRISTTSGTVSYTVQQAPTYSRGFAWVGKASNPEIHYWTREGNTLTVSWPNRKGNISTHEIGEEIRIAHAAEVLNRLEDMMETTFSYEIIDDLVINVFGGPFTLDWAIYTADDQEIEIDDNRTTYVYLRYSDHTIQSSSISGFLTEINDTSGDEYGRLVLTVIASSGQISSVTENRARDFINYNSLSQGTNTVTPELLLSYIDTLTADTIDVWAMMAIHNPGDPTDKQVSIEDIFTHAQAEGYIAPGFVGATHTQASAASTWTITHNLNTEDVLLFFLDSSTPANLIEPDTIDRYTNYVTVTWAGNSVAGKCVVGAPSGTNVAQTGTVLEMTLWEDVWVGKMVRRGVTGREYGRSASYAPSSIPTTYDTLYTGKTLHQTFKALRWEDIIGWFLRAKKENIGDTTGYTVELFATTTQVISWNTYNVPTGSALATATVAHGSLSTSSVWVAFTFASPYTPTAGNFYCLKITASWANTVHVYYGTDGNDYNTNAFQNTGVLTPFSTNDYLFKAIFDTLASESTSQLYLASAFEDETGVIVGATKIAGSQGGTGKVYTHIADSLSGLDTSKERYYLSDIAWEIDYTPGTNTIEAGIPVNSTTLIIR